jgi:hypothetical protein
MRIGCAVPAPAAGRAWLLLCPSREGARGVSVIEGPRLRFHWLNELRQHDKTRQDTASSYDYEQYGINFLDASIFKKRK